MNGYVAAAIAVLIWASYPVATRAGVTGSFAPQDLVTLRFGVGALLFLPYLLLHCAPSRRAAWLQGVPLTLFQGAGMAALVICGLQLAPANHAAALGPGVIAGLGRAARLPGLRPAAVARARSPARRCARPACCCSPAGALRSATPAVLAGDAMFLAASALGALYVLQLRSWGIGAIQGAAIVSLYSALVVVPWYLWSAPATLWRVAPLELLWQVLWQGVLIGCVALVALNHAISRLGAERSSALVALVPVLTRGARARVPRRGSFHCRDRRVRRDLRRRLDRRRARKAAPTPAAPPLAAPPRSAPPAGYPVRDSAP